MHDRQGIAPCLQGLAGQSRVRKSASQFTKLAATNVAPKVTRSLPCTG